ncbi:hypothetical protein [Compostimonas suwonensis]|uniref:Uncharacterized protein n=1 Tax=Compostimonas suwonensis TaxID=1048394 RepID=A0A2M9BCG6_9MICO|nr:hypothetical protein [Compostimonas suwonensis]PJJ55647.1 hypothetical protein CLV54_2997 [Compostimonas suwonensis]
MSVYGVPSAEQRPARRPANPLGVIGLVLAVLLVVVALLTSLLQFSVQLTGGTGVGIGTVISYIVQAVLALACAILGAIGLLQRSLSPASPAAALAIGAFYLLGIVTQLIIAATVA